MQSKFIYNTDVNMTFKLYVSKVFLYVAAGLLVSAIAAFFLGPLFLVFAVQLGGIGAFLLYVPIILELAVAFYFSGRLLMMKKSTAYICYFLYSTLTGITLSFILLQYSIQTTAFAFGSTALLFICMAIIGLTTNIDLSKTRNYISFGLMGIIIASLINMFIGSSTADLIISYVAVIIFLVLIAFDMQNLRYLYNEGLTSSDLYSKLLIYGSFQLYLDFINIFLRLLRIFSRRND